jgi:hypothetical protein
MGVGEHVIPLNIYGFWRIHSICRACKDYFGKEVDGLAQKEPAVLEAMGQLGLPGLDKLYEQLPYVATDVIDEKAVRMVRRGNEYRVKVVVEGMQLFECSESDWPRLGTAWLREQVARVVSDEQFEHEIGWLKEEYRKLKPGAYVVSETLGYGVRKLQASAPTIDRTRITPITHLIAKIAVCFGWYMLPPTAIAHMPGFHALIRHARYGDPLPQYAINWCRLHHEAKYARLHHIGLHFLSPRLALMDVTLFGGANWRVPLKAEEPFEVHDREGHLVEAEHFFLDFSDLERRKKVVGICRKNEGLKYYDLEA